VLEAPLVALTVVIHPPVLLSSFFYFRPLDGQPRVFANRVNHTAEVVRNGEIVPDPHSILKVRPRHEHPISVALEL
jgi:hypothetical protein